MIISLKPETLSGFLFYGDFIEDKALNLSYMKGLAPLVLAFLLKTATATSILIPMDAAQQNHLKAYGIAFYALQKDVSVDWLLNYRGGSFLIKLSVDIKRK